MVTKGTLTWRNPDVKTEETDFLLAAPDRKWRLPGPHHSEPGRRNPPGALATPSLAGIGCAHSAGRCRSESPAVSTLSEPDGLGTISHRGGAGLDSCTSRGDLSHWARGRALQFARGAVRLTKAVPGVSAQYPCPRSFSPWKNRLQAASQTSPVLCQPCSPGGWTWSTGL